MFKKKAQDNSSSVIEVRLRPSEAQWRYRLDVLADGKKIYFDRPSLKVQHFPGILEVSCKRVDFITR